MWKRIAIRGDALTADLTRALDRLTPEESVRIYGALSHDRGTLYLNEHASDAFADVLDDIEFVEDIDAPSEDELTTFRPLFASRFRVS